MMRGPAGVGGFGCLGLFGPLLAGLIGFLLGRNSSRATQQQPAPYDPREDEFRRREDDLRRREEDLRRREEETRGAGQ